MPIKALNAAVCDLTADSRATRTARIASTCPSRVFGSPVASPVPARVAVPSGQVAADP